VVSGFEDVVRGAVPQEQVAEDGDVEEARVRLVVRLRAAMVTDGEIPSLWPMTRGVRCRHERMVEVPVTDGARCRVERIKVRLLGGERKRKVGELFKS
jgi:hypothetical protein